MVFYLRPATAPTFFSSLDLVLSNLQKTLPFIQNNILVCLSISHILKKNLNPAFPAFQLNTPISVPFKHSKNCLNIHFLNFPTSLTHFKLAYLLFQ